MRPSALLPALSLLAAAAAKKVSYDGYQVLRVKTGARQVEVEQKLVKVKHDEWDGVENSHVDVAIAPAQLPAFRALGLDYSVMHEDLGASIAAESAARPAWKRHIDDMAWYDAYHPYDEHKAYMETLHRAFPNNSEIVSSGTSREGRDIFGIHIWGAGGPGKPAVLWHGTVHAREWISAPVVEYLTLQLIQGYGKENGTTGFVDAFDIWSFPIANPDGFVHTHTTDRLWRKNRQPPPPNAKNSSCFGRDINRNWPHKWDANPLGASSDPCSLTYKGEAPADAPETKGLQAMVDKLREMPGGIKLYVDWHAYTQIILAPVGYNCTRYIDTLGQHVKMAQLAADAILKVEGKAFAYGPSCATLYSTTGTGLDYVYEVGRAKWSYLVELRDLGEHGFVLPPEQIRGSVKEQWEGMKVMLGLLDEVFFDGNGP